MSRHPYIWVITILVFTLLLGLGIRKAQGTQFAVTGVPSLLTLQAPAGVDVTRESVTQIEAGLYLLSYRMVVSDASTNELINKTYSRKWRSTAGPARENEVFGAVSELYESLLAEMQADINIYKLEQTYLNHAQNEALEAALETGLSL